jgi:hypothetical protein
LAAKVRPRSFRRLGWDALRERLGFCGFDLHRVRFRNASSRLDGDAENHPQHDGGERPRADRSERQENDTEAPEHTPGGRAR